MIIRTSLENREIVSILTRKFNLGSENHISRIAFSYSITQQYKLNLNEIENSKGKEYSKSVFFGNNYELYVAMICVKYNIHSSDIDIPKYIKMHVDDGLKSINEITTRDNYSAGIDLISGLIS